MSHQTAGVVYYILFDIAALVKVFRGGAQGTAQQVFVFFAVWVRTARKSGIPGPISGPNARQGDVELEAPARDGLNLDGGYRSPGITSRKK